MSASVVLDRIGAPPPPPPPPSASVPAAAVATTVGRQYVRGLDGLRGIAVLLVVAYHATPAWMPGGFAGVDVFFVLSGFLITALLLREKASAGRVKLGRFWLRRIRRLVPAMVVMIAVMSAATILVGNDTAAGLRHQVLGALTWTSNWVQIGQGWSYSDQHLPPLFNHLWSLGIEEQFYLLWPLVLLASLIVVRRRFTQATTLALAVASLALMAWWFEQDDANRAYMGLDSHIFGLLLGAALALSTSPHLLADDTVRPVPSRRYTLYGLFGLGVIVAFALTVSWSDDATFLGGLGLVSIATAGVILAAANHTPIATVLAWAPLRWIGARSYGIYLWHWPIIICAVRLAPPEYAELAGWGAVLAAVMISALSYRWIEVPMCRDGIFATVRTWVRSLRERTGFAVIGRRLVVATALVTMIFAGAAVAQAPVDSEVEQALAEGQDLVVSVEDMPPPTEPIPSMSATDRACQVVSSSYPISAFGDSVTVAVAPVLTARRPGTTAVATVGWQYADVAGAIRQAADAGQLQTTVLIATGTNGVIDEGDLDSLVANELANHQVALVVPSVPGHSWSQQAVDAVNRVAQARDNVHLVDWNAVAAGDPSLTAADRVHPSGHGQNVFADLVDQALLRC